MSTIVKLNCRKYEINNLDSIIKTPIGGRSIQKEPSIHRDSNNNDWERCTPCSNDLDPESEYYSQMVYHRCSETDRLKPRCLY